VQRIEDVAQQQDVNAIQGTVALVCSPGGVESQLVQPGGEELESTGGDGLATGAIYQMKVANNDEHRMPAPK